MDFNRYNSYYSGSRVPKPSDSKPSKKHRRGWFFVLLVVVVIAVGGYLGLRNTGDASTTTSNVSNTSPKTTKTTESGDKKTSEATTKAPAVNQCADNTLDKEVVVSIDARHLWACEYSKVVYDSPVVTGISYLAADLTPTGTYHVYAKQTDTVLTGSDSTGSWSDPVSYWMPFLDNQYGAYGFHDATWRKDSDFGNINPDSADASHGCVELPLATAKWIYNWGDVGLTVVIE